jgi:hypothetical protein
MSHVRYIDKAREYDQTEGLHLTISSKMKA